MSNNVKIPSMCLFRFLIGIAVIGAVVTLGAYFANFHGDVVPGHDAWGQFGDYVGGVLNPLVGLLVVASLYYTAHAAATSAQGVLDQRSEARRLRVFQLHQAWSAPEMHKVRELAHEFKKFRIEAATNAKQSKVFLGAYRESDQPTDRNNYNNLSSVWHFLADVNTLLQSGLLDDELARKLFLPAFQLWMKDFDRLDFRTSPTDTKSEESQKFYADHVAPIATTRDNWQNVR